MYRVYSIYFEQYVEEDIGLKDVCICSDCRGIYIDIYSVHISAVRIYTDL